MSIPYPETMMEPNRTNFLALGAIVGRGKIAGPEKWLEWDRIISKYGWKTVLRAADRVEPINRWCATIEAMCETLKQSEAEEERALQEKARRDAMPRPGSPKESAALFAQIRQRVMGTP